jgi:hypothetical protein
VRLAPWLRNQWPSGHAAETRDELAPPHGNPRADAIVQRDYHWKLALCSTTKLAESAVPFNRRLPVNFGR